MSIESWWPKIGPTTQEWLVSHVGKPLPSAIIDEIAAAGGIVTSDAWWVEQAGPMGFFISESAAEWIESLSADEAGSPDGAQ